MTGIKEAIVAGIKLFKIVDNATQIAVNGKEYYRLSDVAKALNKPYVIRENDVYSDDGSASFEVSFSADYVDTPILLTYEDYDVNGSTPSPFQAVTISSKGTPVTFTYGYNLKVTLSYKAGILTVNLAHRNYTRADVIIRVYKVS